ncbi:MAG: response regulator transcription factor [Oceanicaulis sp.]|nr:response regulator transcription factor [Oceanicaulis sp.]
MKRFLIIEDHTVTALGLEFLLRKNFEIDAIEKFNSGKGVVERIKDVSFDLIFLDILLPKTDTQALASQILAKRPDVRILAHSSCDEEVYALPYLRLGLKGFVSKIAGDQEILLAVKTVLSGNVFLSNNSLLQHLSSSNTFENPFKSLSNRELEVLNQLLTGKGIKEISALMNLGSSTIATQKARIFEKLRINNLLELYQLANQYGLFDASIKST